MRRLLHRLAHRMGVNLWEVTIRFTAGGEIEFRDRCLGCGESMSDWYELP